MTSGKPNYPIGHIRDHRIVRDNDCKCVKFFVHPCDRLKHGDTGLTERACRFVTEEDFGMLGDGSSDRYALLLAAGHFRRKMIHALVKAHHRKRHGVARDVRDQLDVLAGRSLTRNVFLSVCLGFLASIALGDCRRYCRLALSRHFLDRIHRPARW
jgi:hypothetical protein